MVDIAVVESKPGVTTLSTEKANEAAGQIKNFLSDTFSSWPEYQIPRQRLEQGAVVAFDRIQGQNGAGIWEVTDYGPYLDCNLANSRGRWSITVQSSDQGPRTDPVMFVQRNKKVGEREIYESPPKNSREALSLILEFVEETNGGKMPPELVNLGR